MKRKAVAVFDNSGELLDVVDAPCNINSGAEIYDLSNASHEYSRPRVNRPIIAFQKPVDAFLVLYRWGSRIRIHCIRLRVLLQLSFANSH